MKSFMQGTPICDPGSGLVAKSPRDFTVLVNTADFLEDVLGTLLADATQMEHWIIPLITRLVALSTELPLVSSFHKMLAATLTLSHKISFFEVNTFPAVFPACVSLFQGNLFSRARKGTHGNRASTSP